jgi:hypothetical protein
LRTKAHTSSGWEACIKANGNVAAAAIGVVAIGGVAKSGDF